MAGSSTAEPARGRPVFYYDVGSPWCWLVGERVHQVLGEVPVWQPVLDRSRAGVDRDAVERRAVEQGIAEVRWPEPFPFDTELAMRVATFAKQTGRAVAFSLAAMRQAFLAGRDLSVLDNVLIAAAACELHPRAVTKALETRSVDDALRDATGAAALDELPAIAAGGALATGPDAPESLLAQRELG
jgi:2-hydroxychromene-2-carboxylate isomerase